MRNLYVEVLILPSQWCVDCKYGGIDEMLVSKVGELQLVCLHPGFIVAAVAILLYIPSL